MRADVSLIPPCTRDWDALLPSLASPALVYDIDRLHVIVERLRRDIAPLNAQLLVPIKANRNPSVLRHLADLGFGADVASTIELRAARRAGLRPLSFTAPLLTPTDAQALALAGADVDLSSLEQVRLWGADESLPREVGLRIRLPLSPAEHGGPAVWSRFGVNPASDGLHDLLIRHGLRVVRIHGHAGELWSSAHAARVAETFNAALSVFPEARTINLGGGIARIYADRSEARSVWETLARTFPEGLRFAIEPGMALLGMTGYLLCRVVAVDERRARTIATLDASAWNLVPWHPLRVATVVPLRATERVYDLAGATCYEDDYFAKGASLPELRVGDALLFARAGAYVESMARSTHGLSPPRPLLIRDDRILEAS